MRALLAVVALAAVTACGGRGVEIETGPEPAAEVAVQVTNNLTQAVNVYVVSGGNEMFLRQVPANTTEHVPVSGVATGSTVTLRAATVDGTRGFRKDNVVLSGTYVWTVP